MGGTFFSTLQWSKTALGSACMWASVSVYLATGVAVEARLGCGPLCGDDFGVLDPGFFLLEFLERRGRLRHVRSEAVGAGWVVVAGGVGDD